MTSNPPTVVAGVDAHTDTQDAAVITTTGARLRDDELRAAADGYRQLTRFITNFGQLQAV